MQIREGNEEREKKRKKKKARVYPTNGVIGDAVRGPASRRIV